MMLKIGDFSKLSRVTVQALRHYDELGLLKPAHVDGFTGYRYYSANQLPRLYRILALKDLGLSLEQIAHLLKDNLSAEELRGMLKMKRAEIAQRLDEEQERLARVEARLRQSERENTMSNYEVVVKKVEPQWVASVRDVIPNYKEIGPLYGELYTHLGPLGLGGPGIAIWHDEGYKERAVDAEAGILLNEPAAEGGRVKVHQLPEATVASVVHHGSYATINQAYDAISKWLETSGYKIVAPSREVYLHVGQPVRQDDESYVTEIQFPVEKA
jgi:effector-binding domain-containing protein